MELLILRRNATFFAAFNRFIIFALPVQTGISSYAKNYREVDYVLWGASVIRMKTLDNFVKPQKDVSGILVKVFGDIFIGITSNAIWVLVSNIFK